LLEGHGIDTVLDVGANAGQYARSLRRHGFAGDIVSFEPLTSAFERLEAAAESDPRWTAVHAALGSEASQAHMHVAGNSASSSILEMLPKHLEVAPESRVVGAEDVTVIRLDSVLDQYVRGDATLFLKIDTQGYERQVLEGAAHVLPRISGMQLELSLEPMYRGETLAEDMIALVRGHGFTPVWIGHGLRDPADLRLLQLDALFFRL
jgi:FkbM family methyltransferase